MIKYAMGTWLSAMPEPLLHLETEDKGNKALPHPSVLVVGCCGKDLYCKTGINTV